MVKSRNSPPLVGMKEGGGAAGPKGVAYFCAVLPDGIPDAEAEEHVRAGARSDDPGHQRGGIAGPGAVVAFGIRAE